MPFMKDETEETKNRIIDVARCHFSANGFDATRVDAIAKDAGINKALIYYYFKNKKAILDYLIQKLFDDISSIAMTFVENNVIPRIEEGKLDILSDRWCFVSEEEANSFYKTCLHYYEEIVDFALENREVIRILVFESLKNGNHHNGLFRMFNLLYDRNENSLYKTLWEADHDFDYSTDNLIFKIFFGFIPLFNFAAYFDDYVKYTGISDGELRASFLRTYEKLGSIYINGKDIILA